MNSVIKEDKKYKLNRPITGVIHKDRIWEQWYNPEDLKQPLPKMNQRDYLFLCNQGFENQKIINNRGYARLSVKDLENLCDSFARTFLAYELEVGDRICTIGLSSPDLVAIKYASATVGTIASNLNFDDALGGIENNKLYKHLSKLSPRVIFYLDILENKVSEILNLPEFKDILKVRMPISAYTPSLNLERLMVFLLNKSNQITKKSVNNSISLSQFKAKGLGFDKEIVSVYSEKLPANIAFTSATTGESKAVVLSHDANNALAHQHKIANLGLQRGDTNLALVPPFLAFWDADIIHMAMCLGIENILELALTYENIPKYLRKHLPDYGIWSQYLWDSVLHMSLKEIDLIKPHIKMAVVGGERAEINQVNRFKEQTGILQVAGFGATEMDSCFSVAHPNCNLVGSAGLPLPFNNVRIKDESMNDLTYNQPGRIWVNGPAMMNGYYNRPDLTKMVLIQDEEGTLWYDTKDYGYVDITGSIVPLDRDSNSIYISNNRIKLQDIAEKIKGYENVKLCKINRYNMHTVAHITLDNFSTKTEEVMMSELLRYIQENLLEVEKPDIINLLSTLPRTPLGKVDYVELEKMTKEIIEKKAQEESTLAIGDEKKCKVYKNIFK